MTYFNRILSLQYVAFSLKGSQIEIFFTTGQQKCWCCGHIQVYWVYGYTVSYSVYQILLMVMMYEIIFQYWWWKVTWCSTLQYDVDILLHLVLPPLLYYISYLLPV